MPRSNEGSEQETGFRSDAEMLAVVTRRAEQQVADRRRRQRLVTGGIAALVVVLLGVSAFAVIRDHDSTEPAQQVDTGGPTSTSTTVADGVPEDVTSEGWTPMADSPLSKRTRPISAWTGEELLIWGGEGYTTDVCRFGAGGASTCGDQARNDGAAFDPATDTWRMLPPAPLPEDPGSFPTYEGAWTGEELVIWGGPEAMGAAYDPVADSWRTIAEGPLSPRSRFTVARITGETVEIVVVGGQSSSGDLADVAAYDPRSDTWRSLPDLPEGRTSALVVQPMESGPLVLGGYTITEPDADGNVAAPSTLRLDEDGWDELPTAPVGRVNTAIAHEDGVVVTGTELDPSTSLEVAHPAARLEPWSGTWTELPAPPNGAADALLDVEDLLLLVSAWGDGPPGSAGPFQVLDVGAISASGTSAWTEMPVIGLFDGALDGVQGSAMAWTGTELLVWGGGADGGYGADPVAVGARYEFGSDG